MESLAIVIDSEPPGLIATGKPPSTAYVRVAASYDSRTSLAGDEGVRDAT